MNDESDVFPSATWTRDRENVSELITMYRLNGSELRIAMIPGLLPGKTRLCGIYLLFRSPDDDMNMEVSSPVQEKPEQTTKMLKSLVATAVEMSGTAKITHAKFLDSLNRWIADKTAHTKENHPVAHNRNDVNNSN